MTIDGSIFAFDYLYIADHSRYGRAVAFQGDEQEMYALLRCYVLFLRQLRVAGPLQLRVLLTGVSGVRLIPNQHTAYYPGSFRQLQTDIQDVGPVVLGSDIDGTAVEPIAEAMRPEIILLGQDAGLGRDPCFDDDGKYRPDHD